MSEQKGKIIIAMIAALIAVLILTGVSYYFFPQVTPSSPAPKPAPMIPLPSPSNTTDTFAGADALASEYSSVSWV